MDIFDAVAKITIDTSQYDAGIRNAKSEMDGFGDSMDNAGGSANLFTQILGGNLVAKGVEVAISGLKRLGDVAVNVFKDAISSYADYEQLVGGVDTIFKSASGKVQKYASEAYKTAGISANQYMETVTSFSASLIQSLEGDTEKAAEVANQAIIDMSDNANKMGTSMQSIQNAYQGFAKQNYMMLDNLKLGYGGTKTEMERLILDAEKLDQTFRATRNTNGDLTMSYADIVEAIHIVQTDMDITGTTAKEAGETISGSVASMKSAWANLVAGLGSDTADMDKLIDDFVKSADTALDNLLPVAERAFLGLIDVAMKMLPDFLELGAKIGAAIIKGILMGLASIALKPVEWIYKTLNGTYEHERHQREIEQRYESLGIDPKYYRANGGFMQAGIAYVTDEFGQEVVVPSTNSYAYTAKESEQMFSRDIVININGDVYDDERSMRDKLRSAVVDIIATELAYG